MELDLVNEWTDGVPVFTQYTLIDISAEVIDFTETKQKSFSFVILGLGFRLFWNSHDISV